MIYNNGHTYLRQYSTVITLVKITVNRKLILFKKKRKTEKIYLTAKKTLISYLLDKVIFIYSKMTAIMKVS